MTSPSPAVPGSDRHDDDGCHVHAATGRLFGRSAELAVVDGLLDSAVTRGAALLLTGEAGVGKSALLEVAALRAARAGFRVVRVVGSQFEESISYSALNQVLQPLVGEIPALPTRQAEALQVVRGFSEGQSTDLLAIANAVHALLSRAGTGSSPLALVIDDVAWLDRSSAAVLATVARYVRTGSLALLAASRSGDDSFLGSTGMPTYEVRPLADAAAHALVAERFPEMTDRVRRRIVEEARGNPLALLELPATLDGAQLTERGSLPSVLPLSERLRGIFSTRVAALPDATRNLLLLAVLDGTGDLHALRRAADDSDALSALSPAEREGIVRVDTITGRLVFRHPLTRSAVMDLSTSDERRRGHRVLARRLPEGSELRARHLAQATVGTDEQVAALLHEAAYRTLRRGDAVGAVTTLLRASELSATGPEKGRRLAEAACLGANVTGDLRNVQALLDNVGRVGPMGADSLAAATAAASRLLNGEGDVDTAHRLLASAIDHHEPPDGADTGILREALHTLLMVSFFGNRPELWHTFESALKRFHRGSPGSPLLTVTLGTFGDPTHAAPNALDRLDRLVEDLHTEADPTCIIRTAIAGAYVDRLPACRSALRRVVDDGRDGGAITSAIEGLFLLGNDAWHSGQWEDLRAVTDEGLGWCATYNYRLLACSGQFLRGLLAAARGDGTTAREIADRLVAWGNPRGLAALRVYASHVRALSALGSADFEAAYQLLEPVTPPGELPPYTPHVLWLLLDLAEAAARTGRHRAAAVHVAAVRQAGLPEISTRLSMVTDAAEAMAVPGHVDRHLFEAALATPGAERWPFDGARIRLAYGERLRRDRAGVEARRHLEAALTTFERLGAVPWRTRAANELRANGTAALTAVPAEGPASPLTPQERRVAGLAATGLTNKQIAARLFLSPRTVAAHLRGVFRKLDVTSRGGLRDALTGRRPHDPTA
ncbi:ATP-binding protein [Streptomyces sp. NPDC059447]|uniref:ATP-binding protein n=1 Tax=Streptomyces sp. NPDC059447 TaxID=3346834 RepID=UPI0036B23F8B